MVRPTSADGVNNTAYKEHFASYPYRGQVTGPGGKTTVRQRCVDKTQSDEMREPKAATHQNTDKSHRLRTIFGTEHTEHVKLEHYLKIRQQERGL